MLLHQQSRLIGRCLHAVAPGILIKEHIENHKGVAAVVSRLSKDHGLVHGVSGLLFMA